MCGIVGYTGNNKAAPILMDGLYKLEYRGYDSAGIAVRKPDGGHEVVKAKGRLSVLADMIDGGNALEGTCGIGHTRWATHGEPSTLNAHPHYNDDYSIVAVHNGIIENYAELKEKLLDKGYSFYSQTDTEIATKIIDYYYHKWNDPVKAMVSFVLRVRGSYAIAVMFKSCPEEIFVAKKDSPLVVGIKEGETYLASDVPAILKYCRDVFYMDDMEIGRLGKGTAVFYNVDSKEIKKQTQRIEWDIRSAEKGGYAHFMMKEIHEQPSAISDTLKAFIKDGRIDFVADGITNEMLKGIGRIQIAACGSAYHVGVVAKYIIEDLARVPVNVDVASEFRYRNPVFGENDLLLVISQSGETADTLAALRAAKEQNVKTLAIVNVLGSVIANEADIVLYTKAGPEISVATTKAYSAQLAVVYALAIQLAYARNALDEKRYCSLVKGLNALPAAIKKILSDDTNIKWLATKLAGSSDVFFIGRGIDYATCLEGSLKLKEISYIHSEAYASGELKHGTISLIEQGVPVVSVITQPGLYEKCKSNVEEVKSRGAYVIAVTQNGNYGMEKCADFCIYIPKTDPCFTASVAIIPLQLLSYYVSVARGLDVDKPRNLAKCVTVE